MRSLLIVLLVGAACSSSRPGEPTSTTRSSSTTPASAEDVAAAFVAAWTAGDLATMQDLATPESLEQAEGLSALAGEAWEFDHCEGAAGTIFCIWVSDSDQLAIGVSNIEEPHLVTTVGLVDV